MKLIVISSPEDFPQEAQLINELFDAGMSCFHLRKPGKSVVEINSLLEQVNSKYFSKISLHQHHFLADKNSIKRLHFTEEIRNKTSEEDLKQLKQKGFTLSTSVHQIKMIARQHLIDYVFLSPVFNSISKVSYIGFADASFTIQKTEPRPEVIALGGIDASNIHQLKTMNFDGAAVLGAIWQKPEKVVSNFKTLQEICLKNSIPSAN